MKYLFLAALLAVAVACDPNFAPLPLDWPVEKPDTILVDTLPLDTLPTDTIIPCTNPEEITEPAFVGGFWYIPEPITDSMQLCAYPHCITVAAGTDITHQLDSLLNVFDPTLKYRVYVKDTDWKVIEYYAIGTNNQNKFHGKVWFRPKSYHSGWGFTASTQNIRNVGAMTFEEHQALALELPSVAKFGFFGTAYDSLQYDAIYQIYLGDCKLGRVLADFRHAAVPTPDTIVQQFIDAGWDTVVH